METAVSQSVLPDDASSQEPWAARAASEGRYHRIQGWTSRILPTPRDIFILLPQTYLLQPARSFPLLIMHDGQNLFDGSLSYVKDSTWRVGTSTDEEIAAGRVAPVVIAGVANTGAERMAEYTPTPDGRLGGGKGPLYARMLVEEIIPMLADAYRLLLDPAHVSIAGSSLGGLISLSIALRYPNRFGNAAVISPSIWWDDRTILKDVHSLPEHLPLRIWLDMGTGEGTRHIRDAALLAHQLESRGWKPGKDLEYHLYPDALHNEEAWAARFADILQFLYPAG